MSKALVGEIIEPKKQRRPIIPERDDFSRIDRKILPDVAEGVRDLDRKNETFEERQQRLEGQRVPYASMQAHMEMAAIVLAAGGTYKLAAAKAGISVRQVKKYYTSADFRKRIEELRSTRFSKIIGRVLKELEARTSPGKIDKIELLDLLRVWDRVAGPVGGKGGGINIAGDVNVNNYDSLIAALLASNSEGESGDFPSFSAEELRLPEGRPSE